jgi:hypothetical protein
MRMSLVLGLLIGVPFEMAIAQTTFVSSATIEMSPSPACLAIGDLNADGKLDLVVGGDYWATMYISGLSNETVAGGTPEFAFTPINVSWPGWTTPMSIAIADINGDGKPDLVVTTQNSFTPPTTQTVSVFLNSTPAGVFLPSFAPETNYAAPSLNFTIGDLNGDGKPDLAFSSAIWLNTTPAGASAPSFVMTAFGDGSVGSLVIGDINGDGRSDIVSASSLWLSTTSTGFVEPSFVRAEFSGTGNTLSVTDINRDGKPDLVTTDGSAVSVFLNTTSAGGMAPSFSRAEFSLGGNVNISGDLNGDGMPDLISEQGVLWNSTPVGSTTPTFSKTDYAMPYTEWPARMAMGDLNGDGRPDLAVLVVISHAHKGYVNVFLNSRIGSPDVPVLSGPASGTIGIPTNTTLTWNSSAGATSYQLQVSTDVGFASMIVDQSSITATSFTLSGLTGSTLYYWRVRATNEGGVSLYSASWSFVTVGVPSGLVAAYSFDEGTGTTAVDASGHGLSGTVKGATWTTQGRYHGALSFNGTSSYVDLGNPSLLQMTGSMTWSAWVKATGNPADDGQIIAKSDDNSGWQLKSSPDTGPQTFGVAVSASSTIHTQRYSKTVRALNTWYHVAGVYNATAQTLDIYVNGVLDNGVLRGTIPGSQYNSPLNVNIGRRTGGFYFKGVIDELRVYNRALEQAEIQSDMNIAISASCSSAAQLASAKIAFQDLESGMEDGRNDPSQVPKAFNLHQNFPNPFNPSTYIRFDLPMEGNVTLKIYNFVGQLVETLVDSYKVAGYHQVRWNANVPSGIYFCRLQTNDLVVTRKMTLLK